MITIALLLAARAQILTLETYHSSDCATPSVRRASADMTMTPVASWTTFGAAMPPVNDTLATFVSILSIPKAGVLCADITSWQLQCIGRYSKEGHLLGQRDYDYFEVYDVPTNNFGACIGELTQGDPDPNQKFGVVLQGTPNYGAYGDPTSPNNIPVYFKVTCTDMSDKDLTKAAVTTTIDDTHRNVIWVLGLCVLIVLLALYMLHLELNASAPS